MNRSTAIADWMIIIACPIFVFDIFCEPSVHWLQFTAALFVVNITFSAVAGRIRSWRAPLSDADQPRDA